MITDRTTQKGKHIGAMKSDRHTTTDCDELSDDQFGFCALNGVKSNNTANVESSCYVSKGHKISFEFWSNKQICGQVACTFLKWHIARGSLSIWDAKGSSWRGIWSICEVSV